MASTNFLVFDEGKQNMMSDGDYSANTQRARGVTPGIAYPNLHNKLYYQVSVMAKAIADFMVAQGANASDEDVEQLTADISTAFTNFVDNKTKDVYLPLSGGTLTGNLDVSEHNITADKFIGNLQGNADSADKLGISTVGSATKPVYINNGIASAVNVDLSTLAPKTSPGLTGTPTAPTADVDTNNTQIATCGFVRNAIAKYASMLDTMKKIYPVGSIYISTVSTNPSELFGFGTWEAMPAGRVLLAQGNVETENYTHNFVAGETGGEFVHQLTVGEMPEHNHSASTDVTGEHNHKYQPGIDNGSNPTSMYHPGLSRLYNLTTLLSGNHTHTITIDNTGSNTAHNNMMPYIVVYMWQRTA